MLKKIFRGAGHKQALNIGSVLKSKKFKKELFLLILLGFFIVINMELSGALRRLEFGRVSIFVPYLSFVVFLFKKWTSRFIFLIVVFLTGLFLGALKI